MNAPVIRTAITDEADEAREILRVMRETALANAAVHHGGWVGDLGAIIAGAANHLIYAADAPLVALEDAKKALQHLQRAQRILGHLDGTYPTDRYKPDGQ